MRKILTLACVAGAMVLFCSPTARAQTLVPEPCNSVFSGNLQITTCCPPSGTCNVFRTRIEALCPTSSGAAGLNCASSDPPICLQYEVYYVFNGTQYDVEDIDCIDQGQIDDPGD